MTDFNLIRIIKNLRKIKFTLSVPKKCDILILDASGATILSKLCGSKSNSVLDIGRLNLPVLLATILRGHMSMADYRNSYIRWCDPRIVITNIDNELYFFSIKSSFPKITTIAVQNGWRANYSSKVNSGFFTALDKSDSPGCDFYCVFNRNIGNYLSRYIATEPIVTGSVKNNSFLDNSRRQTQKTVAFISQHPPRAVLDGLDGNFFGDTFVSDQVFYEVDLRVATYLSKFCEANDLCFYVP